MRHILVVPAMLLLVACGSGKLSRREAEKDIRADYPVPVDIRVPRTSTAVKGSKEDAELTRLQGVLSRTGWFTFKEEQGQDRRTLQVELAPGAPASVGPTPHGWSIPVAEAEFVKALKLETRGNQARVTYQIRLVKPTAQFPLFQALHPGAKIGDTKSRHAQYRKEGRAWVLQSTDEFFVKQK